MKSSIHNMYQCLSYHPAISNKIKSLEFVNIFVGTDAMHTPIGCALENGLELPFLGRIEHLSLEKVASDILQNKIINCDIFIFFYAASTLCPPSPSGPIFLPSIKGIMRDNWRKSVLFKDYGPHFFEAFSEPIEKITERNTQLIDIASRASHIYYTDNYAGVLQGNLQPGQKWTSIDGRGNEDIVPGEIATHLPDLHGQICFSGTFLSTIPFARKYGVVRDFMTLTIKAGQLIDFDCASTDFQRDFNLYLDQQPGNRVVEEFGIGTNLGVTGLYGRNAGFEERHPGLHLGLGGGEMGSHHLDLIFEGGALSFDDTPVFDNGFLL